MCEICIRTTVHVVALKTTGPRALLIKNNPHDPACDDQSSLSQNTNTFLMTTYVHTLFQKKRWYLVDFAVQPTHIRPSSLSRIGWTSKEILLLPCLNTKNVSTQKRYLHKKHVYCTHKKVCTQKKCDTKKVSTGIYIKRYLNKKGILRSTHKKGIYTQKVSTQKGIYTKKVSTHTCVHLSPPASMLNISCQKQYTWIPSFLLASTKLQITAYLHRTDTSRRDWGLIACLRGGK